MFTLFWAILYKLHHVLNVWILFPENSFSLSTKYRLMFYVQAEANLQY
jgi:hypothetical protein